MDVASAVHKVRELMLELEMAKTEVRVLESEVIKAQNELADAQREWQRLMSAQEH